MNTYIKKKNLDIQDIIDRLINCIKKSLNKNDYEKALAALNSLASLEYVYNQEYRNDYIENCLIQISDKTKSSKDIKCGEQYVSNTVIFYDGFGVDLRGLALIYLNSLINLNYKVIYITAATDESSQPEIMKVIHKKDTLVLHMPNKCGYIKKLEWLRKTVHSYKTDTFFFYTKPDDVCGAIAFYELQDKGRRFQINLTDHAFWVGVNALDYCIEFRDYGASISNHYRRISRDKLIELPYYPYIDRTIAFQGFSFETVGKKIVFSGGALYKTIDTEQTFYKLIEYIVENHEDVVFVYAGCGDSTLIDRLVGRYPGKVYHLPERKDLYRVLENSYIYLNTYPISGALMLQYAVEAGCLPVTLKREWDGDASGILLNERSLNTTFTEYKDICEEIDRLIIDEQYWINKKANLKNAVISETEFETRLNDILRHPKSSYLDKLDIVDTKLFRHSYKINLTELNIVNSIIKKDNRKIFTYFPNLLINKLTMKLKKLR